MNYSRKYVIARILTFICLIISACSIGYEYMHKSISGVLLVFAATFVGIPACLSYYYYSNLRGEDIDPTIIGTETLEKAEEKDHDLGLEMKK